MHEFNELSFEYFSNSFIVTCIYKVSQLQIILYNIGFFLDGLEMYLSSINNSHPSIICGDINIDILNQNNSLTSIEYLKTVKLMIISNLKFIDTFVFYNIFMQFGLKCYFICLFWHFLSLLWHTESKTVIEKALCISVTETPWLPGNI